VAIETTNNCNAICDFCPNNAMQRDRTEMSDELFEKIIDDCTQFPLAAIEPFLNGEPFMDRQIIPRLRLIRRKLPETKLRLYTNGTLLTPKRIAELSGIGIDHLYISLNTLDTARYKKVMGLSLRRTLENIHHLCEPGRRDGLTRRITIRMTRMPDIPLSEQRAFVRFCRELDARPFIVGPFNYKGEISSGLPVPNFPCEHITRVDILSNGRVALCCMDHEGQFSWGDVNDQSVLEIYRGERACYFREMLRTGRRRQTAPCDVCNVFWPSLENLPLLRKASFTAQYVCYLLKHRPTGKSRA
jgi:molybdenum cofactor biosynthesis enzyme MoaA